MIVICFFLLVPYFFIYKKIFSQKSRFISNKWTLILIMSPLVVFIVFQGIGLYFLFRARNQFPVADHYITFAIISILMGLLLYISWDKNYSWLEKIKNRKSGRLIPSWLDFLLFFLHNCFFYSSAFTLISFNRIRESSSRTIGTYYFLSCRPLLFGPFL